MHRFILCWMCFLTEVGCFMAIVEEKQIVCTKLFSKIVQPRKWSRNWSKIHLVKMSRKLCWTWKLIGIFRKYGKNMYCTKYFCKLFSIIHFLKVLGAYFNCFKKCKVLNVKRGLTFLIHGASKLPPQSSKAQILPLTSHHLYWIHFLCQFGGHCIPKYFVILPSSGLPPSQLFIPDL